MFPLACHFISLWYKYSPQHPCFETQSIHPPQCKKQGTCDHIEDRSNQPYRANTNFRILIFSFLEKTKVKFSELKHSKHIDISFLRYRNFDLLLSYSRRVYTCRTCNTVPFLSTMLYSVRQNKGIGPHIHNLGTRCSWWFISLSATLTPETESWYPLDCNLARLRARLYVYGLWKINTIIHCENRTPVIRLQGNY